MAQVNVLNPAPWQSCHWWPDWRGKPGNRPTLINREAKRQAKKAQRQAKKRGRA